MAMQTRCGKRDGLHRRNPQASALRMTGDKNLRIILPEPMVAPALAGRQNIVTAMQTAAERAGYTVEILGDSPEVLREGRHFPGYSVYHTTEPDHDRALCFRRAYYYPFWSLELSLARWTSVVAKTSFDPDALDPKDR